MACRFREGDALRQSAQHILRPYLNPLRDMPPPRKTDIEGRRLLASESDVHRARILKLEA